MSQNLTELEHRAYDRGYRDGGAGKLELLAAAKAVVAGAVEPRGTQITCDTAAIHKLDAAVGKAERGWVGRIVQLMAEKLIVVDPELLKTCHRVCSISRNILANLENRQTLTPAQLLHLLDTIRVLLTGVRDDALAAIAKVEGPTAGAPVAPDRHTAVAAHEFKP